MVRRVGGAVIEVEQGNIATQRVDAIVNAANNAMLGGGGVDGALHNAAGPGLLAECKLLPADRQGMRCPTGEVRTTGAGKLTASFVIHAVGPVYDEGARPLVERQLREVHLAALAAAVEHGCGSIAFPAISTGAYRFPIDRAAAIALRATADHLLAQSSLTRVRFVLYTASQLAVFESALAALEVP